MKQTNRILLIIGGVLLLLAVASAITVRVVVGNATLVTGGPRAERVLEVDPFDQLQVNGAWMLTVSRADTATVRITGPEQLIEKLPVRVRDGVLEVGTGSFMFDADSALALAVQVPSLTRLAVAGAMEVDISGFDLPQLTLTAQGASEVTVRDTRIDDLRLETSGAAELNLRDAAVVDAHIELSGASELAITMAGGSLTGAVRGAGEVDYWGEVSSVDVRGSQAVDVRGHQ